jgi:ferritin-like metal-binding protein YciE
MKSNDENGKTSRQGSKKSARSGQQEHSQDMQKNPLHTLFLNELADIYNAEQQLIKALPKMAEAAQSDELREAFETHLEETEAQVGRLDELATNLGESIKSKKCKAMEGLVQEAKDLMDEQEDKPSLDAALIAAAQKVEHYEIATYGTLAAWARQMGHDEAVELLEETLEEEKSANDTLTGLAENQSNVSAETED